MIRTLIHVLAAVSMIAVTLPTEASARQCKRICIDGVCWYDCSKIPGERGVFKGL